MKIYKINVIIVILLSVFLFERCVSDTIDMDEVTDTSNRELSIDGPGVIVEGSVSDLVQELDLDTLVETDENGLLWFKYDIGYTFDWQNLLTLNDISGEYSYDLSEITPILQYGSSLLAGQSIDFSENIVMFSDEDIRLDSLWLKSSMFNMNFDITSGLFSTISLSIPQLYSNGQAYEYVLTSNDLDNGFTLDLSNFYLDFTNNGTTKNSFDVEVHATFSDNINISEDPHMNFSYAMDDFGLEKAYGNFGQKELVNEEEKLDFSAFDMEYLGTTIDLKTIKFDVIGNSSFGVPLSAKVGDITVLNTDTKEQQIFEISDNEFNLDAYIEGDSVIPTDTLNFDLTDISSDFNPNQIISQIQVNVNQDLEDEGFVSDTSTIGTTISLHIPFWFRTSDYTRQDTIEFDYNDQVDSDIADKISELELNLELENGLPFEVQLQVYMIDEDYNIVDSLYQTEEDKPYVQAAKINDDGSLSEGTTSSFSVNVDSDNLDLWGEKDVKYMILKMDGITANDGEDYVQVSEDNYIKATLSFSVSGKIDE